MPLEPELTARGEVVGSVEVLAALAALVEQLAKERLARCDADVQSSASALKAGRVALGSVVHASLDPGSPSLSGKGSPPPVARGRKRVPCRNGGTLLPRSSERKDVSKIRM